MTGLLNNLTNRGYAALVVAYFGIEGLSPTLHSIPMEYFNKAVDWLTRQPNIDPNGVGIIAGSKGSEAGLLVASLNPKIKVVVSIAPSASVFWGIRGPGGKDEIVSSWSYQGQDVPFTPIASTRDTIMKAMQTHRFITLYQEAIAGPEAARGIIKIEQAKAAILLVSGKNDDLWPSRQMAETIVKRLQQQQYPYTVEHLSYDAGHNVISKARESWLAILKFLDTYFRVKMH